MQGRLINLFALGLVLLVVLSPLSRAQNSSATGPHIEVSLLSEHTALVPGETAYLGVLLAPEAGWHTYWRNPGDSGEAPAIEWQSAAPLSFAEIQWPLPQAIPVAHLVNYGYDGKTLLMVAVSVPDNLAIGQPVNITANLSWLVCKEDCIPGWATLAVTLPVQNSSSLSEFSPYFATTRQTLPQEPSLQGNFEITEEHVVVELSDMAQSSWRLFPFRSDLIQHAAQQTIIRDNNMTRFLIPRSAYFNGQAEQLDWLLTDGNQGYYLNTLATGMAPVEVKTLSLMSVLTFSAMAFLGGLILNLMPCVLPILSIKAMALQSQSAEHKFAYLVGVLLCFNAFALVIIGLQLSGQQVGWGFHMQEPLVVAALAFLFTFVALVLFDSFQLNSSLAGIGQGLVSGNSATAHFATGALAVVVASPCTAPFMAAALGIALVSEVYVTLIIFNALALGFALPMTLLFMSRRVMAWLPKPGPWMQTFKHILAFPMLATVAWLCWVYAGQAGNAAQFILLLTLIIFSLFAWLVGKVRHVVSKGFCALVILGSLLSPFYISANLSPPTASNDKNLPFKPFEQQSLQSLRDQQQVILVNMTADWCITCKVNEQVAFSNEAVQTLLAQDNVHYMVGDWTNKNAEILGFLNQYERAGVPLYVVYAGNDYEEILPQILSPGTIIEAINTAKKEISNVN